MPICNNNSGMFTICYFLKKEKGNRFLSCYDIDSKHAKTLGEFYGFDYVEEEYESLLNRNPKLVYVASNHHSHTDYAIRALERGIDVYVEKPISVTFGQFERLERALHESNARIFAGYNRPYSGAITDLRTFLEDKNAPMSLNYFVSGHKIEKDHWYRRPEEGTRICGNVGHWLDLTIHLFAMRGKIPDTVDVAVAYSNPDEPDDNISITLTTDFGDIVNIMLTSRCEPFEGINETINLQCENVIAKIDDFRRMTVWEDEKLFNKRYWPKDVGHRRAILQPFSQWVRDWNEVKISTALMLHIKEMVLKKEKHKKVSLVLERKSSTKDIIC